MDYDSQSIESISLKKRSPSQQITNTEYISDGFLDSFVALG